MGQFDAALDAILAVVHRAGGTPRHIGRLTIFVTDMGVYRATRKELGEVYRARFGRHYPAMTLVEVSALVDPEVSVEIEATAVIPASGDGRVD